MTRVIYTAGIFAIAVLWATVAPPAFASHSWRYDFSESALNLNFWTVANEGAPGYIANNHIGYSQSDRVAVGSGYLTMTLTQEAGQVDGNSSGVISRGAGIYTKNTYGYGTYEWRMRMSSTASSPTSSGSGVSGSVSAGFNYINNSESEIDFEFAGHALTTLFMTNWRNLDTTKDPTGDAATGSTTPLPDIVTAFHAYKFIWNSSSVQYYVDDVLKATHTTDVPVSPAHFMINHWGTNNPGFGGTATLGVTRYFHVDWVRYTAPGETPVPEPGGGEVPPGDTQPPFVIIVRPLAGDTLTNRQKIEAQAFDNVGVAKVEFYGDDIIIATDKTSPYTASWNTRRIGGGQHTLKAVAYDAAGNTAYDQITVYRLAMFRSWWERLLATISGIFR